MAGPHDGEVIAAQGNRTGMQCVHRAKFLDELVKAVPSERCHFGKRLETIEEGKTATDPITLHFKDGTSTKTDAVIGADGIHSTVRKHILGKDNPATYPTFSGCTSYRGMASMDSARERLGAEIAENSSIPTEKKISFQRVRLLTRIRRSHAVWEKRSNSQLSH